MMMTTVTLKTGNEHGLSRTLNLSAGFTFDDLQEVIMRELGLPPLGQILICSGSILNKESFGKFPSTEMTIIVGADFEILRTIIKGYKWDVYNLKTNNRIAEGNFAEIIQRFSENSQSPDYYLRCLLTTDDYDVPVFFINGSDFHNFYLGQYGEYFFPGVAQMLLAQLPPQLNALLVKSDHFCENQYYSTDLHWKEFLNLDEPQEFFKLPGYLQQLIERYTLPYRELLKFHCGKLTAQQYWDLLPKSFRKIIFIRIFNLTMKRDTFSFGKFCPLSLRTNTKEGVNTKISHRVISPDATRQEIETVGVIFDRQFLNIWRATYPGLVPFGHSLAELVISAEGRVKFLEEKELQDKPEEPVDPKQNLLNQITDLLKSEIIEAADIPGHLRPVADELLVIKWRKNNNTKLGCIYMFSTSESIISHLFEDKLKEIISKFKEHQMPLEQIGGNGTIFLSDKVELSTLQKILDALQKDKGIVPVPVPASVAAIGPAPAPLASVLAPAPAPASASAGNFKPDERGLFWNCKAEILEIIAKELKKVGFFGKPDKKLISLRDKIKEMGNLAPISLEQFKGNLNALKSGEESKTVLRLIDKLLDIVEGYIKSQQYEFKPR